MSAPATDNLTAKTSLIYVIDPPALMIEAILLSASVRRHMPEVDLIAYCPAEKADLLPPQICEYLDATNTQLKLMPTAGVFSPHYKQGNKLIAAAQHRPHDFTVFLDTDTVLWQRVSLADMIGDGIVAAAPEGRRTWGKPDGHWQHAYSVFGMHVPAERIPMARTKVLSPPYFNAGVVAFPNAPVTGASSFGECWLQTALELDQPEHDVPIRRPYLDQIALPIAIRRASLNCRVLDDRFNLSLPHKDIPPGIPEHKRISWQKDIDRINSVDPFILHYHTPSASKGLRYDGYLDELMRESTVFRNISEAGWTRHLDFDPKAIMTEFFHLKAIPRGDRTTEQIARFREVDAMKKKFKQMAANPRKFLDIWPASILPNPDMPRSVGCP